MGAPLDRGALQEELAAVATLEVVRERAAEFDGVVIACYGDPGLFAAREISPVPVVGIEQRCASIRTTELTVLDCERNPRAATWEIVAAARLAIAEDGAEAICLGCAGMGPLDKAVEAEVGVPVLDGVACAVKLVESLVDYGLSTSRVAAYKEPEPKELLNYPAARVTLPA